MPGLQARYGFAPGTHRAELRLSLSFDPSQPGASDALLALRGRLGGLRSSDDRGRFALLTSLAAAPVEVTVEGDALPERLRAFVAEALPTLEEESRPVTTADLAFGLPNRPADWPGDFFPLVVGLELGRDKGGPEQPPFVVPAEPGLFYEDVVRFATEFEAAWPGVDGSDAGISLAIEDCGPAFWCVRTGASAGVSLAAPAEAEVAHYAAAPLSTALLSGTVESDSGPARVEDIDLDGWWDSFAEAFDRMEAAAAGGGTASRYARARTALSAALAGRLFSLSTALARDEAPEVQSLLEAQIAADLRSRPVIASTGVDVTRGGPSAAERAVLRGQIASPAGAANPAAAAPASVRLAAGRQRLAYAAPPAGEESLPFAIRFQGTHIDRQGAPTLRLLLHGRGQVDPLAVDLGTNFTPAPLIAAPHPPDFAASAAAAWSASATLGEALGWAVEVDISTPIQRQDRLDLALDSESFAATAPPPAPAHPGALFEALGRAVLFAQAAPAGPDPATVERFAGLAEAVALALPGWSSPEPDLPALLGKWLYTIDLRDLPALIVGRATEASGALPPWPAVAGFVTPAGEEASARYEPEPGRGLGTGLSLILPGLRLLGDRSVRLRGRIRRNGGLVEAVDPAFVYHGPIASSAVLKPRLDWRAPETEPGSPSLVAALESLLRSIDEGSGRPYALSLEATLVRRLEADGGEPLETRIPLGLLPPIAIGGEEGTAVADLAAEVAAALSEARPAPGPEQRDSEIALALTLPDSNRELPPLARLHIRIPVSSDAGWWSSEAPRRRDWRR